VTVGDVKFVLRYCVIAALPLFSSFHFDYTWRYFLWYPRLPLWVILTSIAVSGTTHLLVREYSHRLREYVHLFDLHRLRLRPESHRNVLRHYYDSPNNAITRGRTDHFSTNSTNTPITIGSVTSVPICRILYADDILLLAPSVDVLQLLLHTCKVELRKLDLYIVLSQRVSE